MSLTVPTLLQKPAELDFTGSDLIFKFQVQSNYDDYDVYDVRLILTINNEVVYFQETQIDGIVTIDVTEAVKSFFSEITLPYDVITEHENVSFTFNYSSVAKIEYETSTSISNYNSHVIYNLNFPEALKEFLSDNNNTIVDYVNNNRLILNPFLSVDESLNTYNNKKEFFSFILDTAASSYLVTYSTKTNDYEIVVNYNFQANVLYTIEHNLADLAYADEVTDFEIEIGSIRQKYLVNSDYNKQVYELIYINSMNLFSSIILTGESKKTVNLTKLSYINSDNLTKSFNNEFRIKYSINTQYLYDDENVKLIELINSSLILIELNDNWEELTLDTSDFNLSSDGVAFNSNELSFITAKAFTDLINTKYKVL